jgi:hypothetical protein
LYKSFFHLRLKDGHILYDGEGNFDAINSYLRDERMTAFVRLFSQFFANAYSLISIAQFNADSQLYGRSATYTSNEARLKSDSWA